MKLRVVSDIDSEKLWLSESINYGDWPFRFYLRLEYVEHYSEEWAEEKGKYLVSIGAVSPTAAEAVLPDAAASIGMSVDEFLRGPEEAQCEELIRYGTHATFAQYQGNNLRNLLKEAREELKKADFLFGFYMDRPQNALGATGWDWIKGDVMGERFRKREEVA